MAEEEMMAQIACSSLVFSPLICVRVFEAQQRLQQEIELILTAFSLVVCFW